MCFLTDFRELNSSQNENSLLHELFENENRVSHDLFDNKKAFDELKESFTAEALPENCAKINFDNCAKDATRLSKKEKRLLKKALERSAASFDRTLGKHKAPPV